MKSWVIVILVVIAIVICFNRSESYAEGGITRSQRIAKGFHGVGHTEGPFPEVFSWNKKIDLTGPGTTVDYDQYSMYSTKIWPTTYQPVTNTCFDELMRACTSSCESSECLNDCQVKVTKICSQKKPKIVHRF